MEPASLMSPALAGGFFTVSATWEAHGCRGDSLHACVLSRFSHVRLCNPVDYTQTHLLSLHKAQRVE